MCVHVYHRIQQLDASLEFRSGLAEKTEEKSSDRLFLTDAEIFPVCKRKTNKQKKHKMNTDFKSQPCQQTVKHTLFRWRKYTNTYRCCFPVQYTGLYGENEGSPSIFCSFLSFSLLHLWWQVKQELKMFNWKKLIKLSTFIFVSEEKMKAQWLKERGKRGGLCVGSPLNEIIVSACIYNS